MDSAHKITKSNIDEVAVKPVDIQFFLEMDQEKFFDSDFESTALYFSTIPNGSNEGVYVTKEILKDNLFTDLQLEQAKQEFKIQSAFNHENIVRCYQWAEGEDSIYGLLERVDQPSLLCDIVEESVMELEEESVIIWFMVNILEGLSEIHARNIIHGDIKLDNIVAQSEEDSEIPLLKICDFGLCLICDEDGRAFIQERMGTPCYIAPEVKKNSFVTPKIDMWSLGIVLYMMCCSYRPDQVDNYKYGSGPIPFPSEDWDKRSPELRDFIENMLEFNPENRISSKEALEHNWFKPKEPI